MTNVHFRTLLSVGLCLAGGVLSPPAHAQNTLDLYFQITGVEEFQFGGNTYAYLDSTPPTITADLSNYDTINCHYSAPAGEKVYVQVQAFGTYIADFLTQIHSGGSTNYNDNNISLTFDNLEGQLYPPPLFGYGSFFDGEQSSTGFSIAIAKTGLEDIAFTGYTLGISGLTDIAPGVQNYVSDLNTSFEFYSAAGQVSLVSSSVPEPNCISLSIALVISMALMGSSEGLKRLTISPC